MSDIAAHRELVVPRAVPTGPYSWGLAVDLDGNVQETQRIPIDINYPVELVAMHALAFRLELEGESPFVLLDEILARFSVRHDLRVTTLAQKGQIPAPLAQEYVPLRSLLHDVRLLGIRFPDRVSDVAMQFRWARGVPAEATYPDTRLFVTFIVKPMEAAR